MNAIWGQTPSVSSSPLSIISDVIKDRYYTGDTIYFTIKNIDSIDRGYTLQVICMTGSESKRHWYGAMYTAYFNNDTSFFRMEKKDKKVNSKNEKINYLIPNPEFVPHLIPVDSSSIFQYCLKGSKLKKGIKIKFRIVPDLIMNEPEYIIETKPFWIFVKPF
jgi:hypothetical protein